MDGVFPYRDSIPWTAPFPIQAPELEAFWHKLDFIKKCNKGLHRTMLPDLNFKRHP